MVDATDVQLAGVQTVPALTPAAVTAIVVSLDIPADTAVGLYYVIAKADADGLEAETNEFNNTLGRVVSIGPDLMVSSLTAPTSAGPGTAIAVSDTVKNQGGGASAASTTRFYLSANATLDAADVALTGGRAVPALAAGATSTGTTTADDPCRPRKPAPITCLPRRTPTPPSSRRRKPTTRRCGSSRWAATWW